MSQQLKFAPALDGVHPQLLLEAAAPIFRILAAERRYTRLAVFASVARQQARPDSDIDLIVEAPAGTSTFGFLRFKQLMIDLAAQLIEYGGLEPKLDDDIRREAVLL